MASNNYTGQGLCPAPFMQASLFPAEGGFTAGRFCSDLTPVECCLPCPSTDWLYADNFNTITTSANWINVASMVCSLFLLVSFAFLPVDKTHRHYLSVCMTMGVALMSLGFIVPLAAKPELCYNEITPNDMHTNATCGISGALLIIGGWCGVMWVFLRAVALHLQICWQMVIGKTFMWGALATGWVIPAIGLTVALVFSGVSFRFGDTCHVNHKNSLASLWVPLLVFAAITVIIQFATFGYCIKVYLASLADDGTTTNSSGMESYSRSITLSPRQAYRRIRRVIELQWRGIAIVLLIIADVVFFVVIFVFMDNKEVNITNNPLNAEPWLLCLVQNAGDKNACLPFAKSLVISEATVMCVLILLSLNGVWSLCLLGRFSMFTGWVDLVMRRVKPKHEFVSADVRAGKHPSNYEMLSRDREVHLAHGDSKMTEGFVMMDPVVVTPLSPVATSYPIASQYARHNVSPSMGQTYGHGQQASLSPSQHAGRSGRETPDYFGREARYKSPARSFSGPRGGTSIRSNEHQKDEMPYWDPLSTQAPPLSQQARDVHPGPTSQVVSQAHRGTYPPPGMDPLSMNKI